MDRLGAPLGPARRPWWRTALDITYGLIAVVATISSARSAFSVLDPYHVAEDLDLMAYVFATFALVARLLWCMTQDCPWSAVYHLHSRALLAAVLAPFVYVCKIRPDMKGNGKPVVNESAMISIAFLYHAVVMAYFMGDEEAEADYYQAWAQELKRDLEGFKDRLHTPKSCYIAWRSQLVRQVVGWMDSVTITNLPIPVPIPRIQIRKLDLAERRLG
ncbi:uncharacterized protein PG986_000784 [Apiospora aurea]|uniref:Uncharacterized protein n=1 Tax=Apiospora aurea TaxID=335848 RepID=A0ABR1QV01_9PEZI